MKILLVSLILLSSICYGQETEWLTNFEEATTLAAEKEQPILMVFAGSDWCKPCIRLEEQVFQSATFQKYTQDELVLLKLDFARKKKNKPSAEQQLHNDRMAEKYNPRGEFPLVLLVNKNGKMIKRLETDVLSSEDFIQQIIQTKIR